VKIDLHHDGHGLNESIEIVADERDSSAGGASHSYTFGMPGAPPVNRALDGNNVAHVQFQHGPRLVAGSTAGVTEGAILAMLIDRYQAFQAGPFSCRENAIILTKLEECLHWTKARADARARRGVLGRNEK
jgi:hypothetical protein